jgi:hypothetical protein
MRGSPHPRGDSPSVQIFFLVNLDRNASDAPGDTFIATDSVGAARTLGEHACIATNLALGNFDRLAPNGWLMQAKVASFAANAIKRLRVKGQANQGGMGFENDPNRPNGRFPRLINNAGCRYSRSQKV